VLFVNTFCQYTAYQFHAHLIIPWYSTGGHDIINRWTVLWIVASNQEFINKHRMIVCSHAIIKRS